MKDVARVLGFQAGTSMVPRFLRLPQLAGKAIGSEV